MSKPPFLAVSRGRTLLLGVFLAALLAPQAADARPNEERERCASSAEQAQQLRDDGKYRRAREEMFVCARSVCPGAIKSDCGKWLSELDRDAPTVVFGAKDAAGKDVLDVNVSMDGEPLQTRLDGKPVLVDVGEHTFSFAYPDGTVKEERLLVRAGEKSRSIVVALGTPAASAAPIEPRPADPLPAAAAPREAKKGSIVPPVIAAGIGVAAFTSFAVFGLTGKSDLGDLDACKPSCDRSRVDSAQTKLTIADISLGVGIVATGVAAYLFLTRGSSSGATATSVRARPEKTVRRFTIDGGAAHGGGYGAIGGTF